MTFFKFLTALLVVVSMNLLMPVNGLAKKVPGNLDCRPEELKKSELQFQAMVKPTLETAADQYSGSETVLVKKEHERTKIFRQWLKMRCTCQPEGLSLFEATMCQALADRSASGRTKPCLLRN